MHPSLAIPILALLSGAEPQQDARSVFDSVAARQAERWASVRNYSVEQSTEGTPIPVPIYYERNTVEGLTTFRAVPINEWGKEAAGTSHIKADDYDRMADAYDMFGDVYGEAATNDPMRPMVVSMMRDGATFLRAGGEAERSGAAYADENPDAANVVGMAQFARRARLVGRDTVGGIGAFLLRADDLSDIELEQPEGDANVTLSSASLWIDAAEYVPLRVQFDGVVDADGSTSPFTLEMLQQDYRQVGPLYEPETRVMRMSGLMGGLARDPAKKKEMEKLKKDAAKAQADYEKMKPQLAQLPPSVRKMMTERMEKSMERLKMIAEEDTFEAVVRSRIIGVNEGPPVAWVPGGS